MTFRANKNGTWVGGDDQSAGTTVYGKLGADWLYAKEVFANKDGVWTRAWTDCRLFDAGGRDWSAPTTVVTTAGSCSTRTQTTTVTRTKTGCPNDVRATTVAAPDCTGCTGTPYVSNACDGCGSITTTPGTGGCPDTTSGSCGSWTASTGDFTEGGVSYAYIGPAGYYRAGGPFASTPPGCSACFPDCYRYADYYVENCSLGGRRGTTTPLSCDICYTLTGEPC